MSAADTLLVTTTGDVHIQQLDPLRRDQIRSLLEADQVMVLNVPAMRLGLWVDEGAYVKRRRLNLLATFLLHPHHDPVLGDALLVGLDLDGQPTAVPDDFLAIFATDLA